MTLSSNRQFLFRTELIVHHLVGLCAFFNYNNLSMEWSKFTIVECISLMNYIWRSNPKLLKIYRIMCILLVRMPLSFWYIIYNNNNFVKSPQIKLSWFVIFYDAFLLYKMYKNKKYLKT